MHELAVTQNLLDLALSEAGKVKAKKISRISLVIGEMSGVVDESVRFYFGFLSKGTTAEGATLIFKKKETLARCQNCGREFAVRELNWVCPDCGCMRLEVISGDELFLESMEVE